MEIPPASFFPPAFSKNFLKREAGNSVQLKKTIPHSLDSKPELGFFAEAAPALIAYGTR